MFSVIKEFFLLMKEQRIILTRDPEFAKARGLRNAEGLCSFFVKESGNRCVIYVRKPCRKFWPAHVLFHEVGHHVSLWGAPQETIDAICQVGSPAYFESERLANETVVKMMKTYGASPKQIYNFEQDVEILDEIFDKPIPCGSW